MPALCSPRAAATPIPNGILKKTDRRDSMECVEMFCAPKTRAGGKECQCRCAGLNSSLHALEFVFWCDHLVPSHPHSCYFCCYKENTVIMSVSEGWVLRGWSFGSLLSSAKQQAKRQWTKTDATWIWEWTSLLCRKKVLPCSVTGDAEYIKVGRWEECLVGTSCKHAAWLLFIGKDISVMFCAVL